MMSGLKGLSRPREESAWRLDESFLHLHRFEDGQTVVYHAVTGDTHLLGPSQLAIFDVLRRGPCTTSSLAGRLATGSGTTLPPEDLEAMLKGLHDLELIDASSA